MYIIIICLNKLNSKFLFYILYSSADNLCDKGWWALEQVETKLLKYLIFLWKNSGYHGIE